MKDLDLTYTGDNFYKIKEVLGSRPGDYIVDPFYLRKDNQMRKPYFWNSETKKWQLISIGDKFWEDNDGFVRKTGK